jgi:hypothetical protein
MDVRKVGIVVVFNLLINEGGYFMALSVLGQVNLLE